MRSAALDGVRSARRQTRTCISSCSNSSVVVTACGCRMRRHWPAYGVGSEPPMMTFPPGIRVWLATRKNAGEPLLGQRLIGTMRLAFSQLPSSLAGSCRQPRRYCLPSNAGISIPRPLTNYCWQKRCGTVAITSTRLMLRSPGIWYLATLFASLGLLFVIALDFLRSRPYDHVLARKFAIPGATGSARAPTPQMSETRQAVIDPSLPSVIREPPASSHATPAAAPATPVSVPMPLPATAGSAPVAKATAPWSSVTVTTQVAGNPNDPMPSHGSKRPQDCLALWDRETHMTWDEWRAACRRTPARP
jgi:hypothetical protein